MFSKLKIKSWKVLHWEAPEHIQPSINFTEDTVASEKQEFTNPLLHNQDLSNLLWAVSAGLIT